MKYSELSKDNKDRLNTLVGASYDLAHGLKEIVGNHELVRWNIMNIFKNDPTISDADLVEIAKYISKQ